MDEQLAPEETVRQCIELAHEGLEAAEFNFGGNYFSVVVDRAYTRNFWSSPYPELDLSFAYFG